VFAYCRMVLFLLACVSASSFVFAANDTPPDAKDIVRNVQDLLRSDHSYARYAMQVITAEWERNIQFESWDDRKGKRFFLHILQPRKDKNTTWLKDGKNLWMYIPRLERDIRIPPSMMLNTWMGSDFTNDDLVKMESVVNDYDHHLLTQDENTWVIDSIAKPDAPVVWGKLRHVIERDGIPLSVAYYDEHGVLVRTMHYSDVRSMDDRQIPTRWEMTSVQHPDKKTVLLLQRIDFNAVLNPAQFTRKNLRARIH